jgi:hypothetical protein
MEREQMEERQARSWINKLDKTRAKWTRSLYGVDPQDPHLYDLLIKLRKFNLDDAAELICDAVSRDQFRTTPASQQEMEDLALACEVKAALVEKHPEVMVTSRYGNVVIYGNLGGGQARRLDGAVRGIDGVNNVEVHAGVSAPEGAI